jgi:hypothetical protein
LKISADLFGNLALTLSAQLSFQSVKEFGLFPHMWMEVPLVVEINLKKTLFKNAKIRPNSS